MAATTSERFARGEVMSSPRAAAGGRRGLSEGIAARSASEGSAGVKRVIQVGVGGFGARWRQVIGGSQAVEYAAIVDSNERTLHEVGDALGVDRSRRFTDYREGIAATEADFVLIVVPPAFHREVAFAAYERGLPVLSEKPIADTWEASKEMVAGAERAGVALAISQDYRYQPWCQAIRDTLASGRLGKLDHCLLEYRLNVTDWGKFRHEMQDPLLIEMAIHHFDLMRWLLRRDIGEVMAQTWNPGWNDYAGDCSGALLLRTTAGESILYEASVADRGVQTGWNGFWRIECEHGALCYRGERVFIERFDSDQPEAIAPPEMPAQRQDYVLRDFLAALEEGRAPETDGRDNLKSLAVVFAALDSTRSGQVKRIADLM
jgi:predicted dehydrogenase